MSKIIYYYQTFTGLKPILDSSIKPTHIHLSSFHFGENDKEGKYIHINDYQPQDVRYNILWDEILAARYQGIKIIYMIGGAGGAFNALFSDYDFYYGLLKKTLQNYPFACGLDLDIEESVNLKDIQRLMRDIKKDFPKYDIVLTPLASSLSEDVNGIGGFIYKDLWNSPEGKYISWFNAQSYGDLNFNELKAIVKNGYPVEKIVFGMLGTQIKSLGNFNEICDEISKCEKEYGYIFGGVFIWEYYDQPKDWLKTMNKIINEKVTKSKKNICKIL